MQKKKIIKNLQTLIYWKMKPIKRIFKDENKKKFILLLIGNEFHSLKKV